MRLQKPQRDSDKNMGGSAMNRIFDLVDQKVQQMERYSEITNRMLYEDIDGVGELIEERQKLITAMDGISLDIKKYISEQSMENQETLNKLMQFEDIEGLNGELVELQSKIRHIRELQDKIIKDDKNAYSRLGEMRDELRERLEQSAKGKKVIDYFSNTSTNVNKGKRLNISN